MANWRLYGWEVSPYSVKVETYLNLLGDHSGEQGNLSYAYWMADTYEAMTPNMKEALQPVLPGLNDSPVFNQDGNPRVELKNCRLYLI